MINSNSFDYRSKFNLEQFAQTAEAIRKRAMEENRLLNNSPDEELRAIMERMLEIKKPAYGNFVAESEPTSTGFKVPRVIRYVDDIYLHPEALYSTSDFEDRQKEISQTRYQAIEELGSALHPNIRRVFGNS